MDGSTEGLAGTHCPQCADYETRVMARDADAPAPEDLRPCENYRMSERFQSWLLVQMGPELKRQVGASGLDRMAMVKASELPAARSPGASPARGLPQSRRRQARKSTKSKDP